VPPKSHGAARQLTMGTASLAYINNNPALLSFLLVMLSMHTTIIPSTGTVPPMESSRQTHRFFSEEVHTYIHTAS
jgi:hypothetical protein